MHTQRVLALGFRWALISLGMVMLGMLSSCGGGGGDAPPLGPVNADPTGYYENTGTLTITDATTMPATVTTYSDLQGIVYNNRLMMFSTQSNTNYLYDGNITITGNTFQGTGYVYVDGQMVLDTLSAPIVASVSGTINQGVTVTGKVTSTTLVNGDFTLNYSSTVNAQVSDLTKIAPGQGVDWLVATPVSSPNIGGTSGFDMVIRSDGTIDGANSTTTGIFVNCIPSSSVVGVNPTSTAIFTVDMNGMNSCVNAGGTTLQNRYTGLAALRIDTVNTTQVPVLVMIMTNREYQGLYAINGEFKL